MKNCFTIFVKLLFLFVFFWTSSMVFAQGNYSYEKGVSKGFVKVKFTPTMATTLKSMKVRTLNDRLITGIASFDAALKSYKPAKMERIFPYDPKHEDKLRKAGLDMWYFVEIDPGVDPQEVVSALKNLKEVSVAECDYQKILKPTRIEPYTNVVRSVTPNMPFNDKMLPDQWHYSNTGQTGKEGSDINLFRAWQRIAGRPDIIVSIHDEGVDVKHEDLRPNIWVNTKEIAGNYTDDDGNGYVDDVNGFDFINNSGVIPAESHGTHVAGTIAAVNNNGLGVCGVAGGTGKNDGVKIMSLRVLGARSLGTAERSYVYAAHHGAVISQNSWGYSEPRVTEQSVADAIKYFIENAGNYEGSPMKGGIVIFAAGNKDSDDKWYPGYYDNVLTVAALGPTGKKATYSNYGDWVQISAPGGNMELFGIRNGILSTLPDNKYGYMDGTSMACPHVSGIAALAIANSKTQMTNKVLWQQLYTGVDDVYKNNPQYLGKLGSGAINADYAIRINEKKAPAKIEDLAIDGAAMDFVNLRWSVPVDEDDDIPTHFNIYYLDEPITAQNIAKATKISIENKSEVGSIIKYSIGNLLGMTRYYFVVTSNDRWNNMSEYSNQINVLTGTGPSIASSVSDVLFNINVSASALVEKAFDILNNSEGILRWKYFIRNKSQSYTKSSYDKARYPQYTASSKGLQLGTEKEQEVFRAFATPVAAAADIFQPIEKVYTTYTAVWIGDIDKSLPSSSATKFFVSEEKGFNLTNVKAALNYTKGTGEFLIEIYKGQTLDKKNLFYAQNYAPGTNLKSLTDIKLDEELYFEKGSEFWIVIHAPVENLYPLGIGFKKEKSYSDYCFYSENQGQTWVSLPSVYTSDYAWHVAAVSQRANMEEYIVLKPGSGDVEGNNKASVLLAADASKLINGTYQANLVISSNDVKNKEFRVPLSLNVEGHKSNLVYPKSVDFGNVFEGDSKIYEIVLDNVGYGLVKDLTTTIDNPLFKVEQTAPRKIDARSQAILKIKYSPTAVGSTTAKVKITNGTDTYNISLFGACLDNPKMVVTPIVQDKNVAQIGDNVEADVTIKNEGGYPLKYFVPGFDKLGVSEGWEKPYHKYGYTLKSNLAGLTTHSLPYNFQDISSSGTDITEKFMMTYYVNVNFGFKFPYYGVLMDSIFITKNGFTTFDNSVNPNNVPRPAAPSDARGYISMIGMNIIYNTPDMHIYYKQESDRLIIQYDNVYISSPSSKTTVQMVLHANGDIRFYYKDVPDNANASSYVIMIEDYDKKDAIEVKGNFSNVNTSLRLKPQTAIGFDYPGPANILTAIENASGVINPGDSAVMKVKISTASLTEGATLRAVNIVSSDPRSPNVSSQIRLDIQSGGQVDVWVEAKEVNFGDIYQNTSYKQAFKVVNNGTKAEKIARMTFDNDSSFFKVSGDLLVSPKLSKEFIVTPVTSEVKKISDTLRIVYSTGKTDKIYVQANVSLPPSLAIDTTAISATLIAGTKSSLPFSFKNEGSTNLEYSVTNVPWANFIPQGASVYSESGYEAQAYNTINKGVYNWIDIKSTGVRLEIDYDDYKDKNKYWNTMLMPFPFEFYGVNYDTLRVSNYGMIALGGLPEVKGMNPLFPITDGFAYILPMMVGSGFLNTYAEEGIGLYYQAFEDKFVISWEYVMNLFGMGNPLSYQAILYKDGSMKFQYKLPEGTPEMTSRYGTVALQRPNSTEYFLVNRGFLDHKEGICYVLQPTKKYVLAAGEEMKGSIEFDASRTYGGTFTNNIMFKTNDPQNLIVQKPVEVTVQGTASVNMPDSIGFGEQEIKYFSDFNVYDSRSIRFDLENTGKAPLVINSASLKKADQYLSVYMLENSYLPINELFIDGETITLLPGNKLKCKAIFQPSAIGNFSDELILATNIGEKKLNLKGNAFLPGNINVDVTPIVLNMNKLGETEKRAIEFDNVKGLSDLKYDVSVLYRRPATASILSATSTVDKLSTWNNSDNSALTLPVTKTSVSTNVNDFNRVIRYTQPKETNIRFGTGGTEPMTVGITYNAGPEGFNLSDVGTYFVPEEVKSGTIEVEVRAGKLTFFDSYVVARGSIDYSLEKSTGEWINIKLDTTATLYPNEDFFVLITYPLNIRYPQGCAVNDSIERVPGRYFFNQNGAWFEAQSHPSLSKGAWQIYAAERSPEDNGWLKVISNSSGSLPVGGKSSLEIEVKGNLALRGDQQASVVFRSNDTEKPEVKVPVFLHMNEAPAINAPQSVSVKENESKEISITAVDTEGHSFTMELISVPEFVASTKNASDLKLVVTPTFGHRGDHNIHVKVTDEHNAVSEMIIPVIVDKTNRAPIYTSDVTQLKLLVNQSHLEYNITDFFSDPDGDDLMFEVSEEGESLIVTVSTKGIFVIRPTSVGTSKLKFVVTDTEGATLTHYIDVEVTHATSITSEKEDVVLKAYPNPVKPGQNLTIEADLTKIGSQPMEIQVINSNGQVVSMTESSDVHTSVQMPQESGVYMVKVSFGDNQEKVFKVVVE